MTLTKSENRDFQAEMQALQDEAKDLQARLGLLTLQLEDIETEKKNIKTLLMAGQAKHNALQRQASEAAQPRLAPHVVQEAPSVDPADLR